MYKEEMYHIPELMKTISGETVLTKEQWETFRKPEILSLFENFVYGVRPVEKPASMEFEVVKEEKGFDGSPITHQEIRITFSGYSFSVHGYLPGNRKENIPSFVYVMHEYEEERCDITSNLTCEYVDFREICRRGYAIFVMHTSQIAPDWEHKANYSKGVFPVFPPDLADRKSNAWATISAWGFGASRVMDYIETVPYLDKKKVTVSGHSRGGKTALWCAALDERFACAISNNSGCTGAAMLRGKGGEHIKDINITDWFCGNYHNYNDNESFLPVDQHMLIASLAPRYVYVSSSDDDSWADPAGERLACRMAGEAFALYGKNGVVLPEDDSVEVNKAYHEGAIGYHVKTGGHGITHFDWKMFLDFLDKKFADNGAKLFEA